MLSASSHIQRRSERGSSNVQLSVILEVHVLAPQLPHLAHAAPIGGPVEELVQAQPPIIS